MSSELDTPLVSTVAGGRTSFLPLAREAVALPLEPRCATSPAVVIESTQARLPTRLVTGGARPGDVELAGGVAGRYVVRGASVRGFGHRQTLLPRQDAMALCHLPDADAVVFAVADGVSQSARSDLGARHLAEEAVTMACREMGVNRSLRAEALAARFEAVAARVARLVHVHDPELTGRDVAATLLVAVVTRRTVRSAVVGDAALWVLDSGGRWRSVFGGADGLVRENRTAAMPIHPHRARHATTLLGPGDVVVGVTDGLDDPLANGRSPGAVFLAERWSSPPELFQFGIDVSFEAGSYDDDRTAVAVWRRE